ncbi:hypothetical protein [Erythrobacter sp. THAF29]|uniref:hypothetical protein n=1 Tax=Erythrobacter sp. THAF29 TaxID=2587851 RepID=UPI0012682C04|nr:hypothetical protein [Erythrobacter sp. THAF29]QFT75997.1 hypothetical protein FIU90_00440 [Erythrobacter sp. THAF29]
MTEQPKQQSSGWGNILLGVVIGGILMRAFFGGDDAEPDQQYMYDESSIEVVDDAVAEETTVAAPSEVTVARAARHAGKVVGAFGTSGAEEYSELCYAALGEKFSVEQRDRCYAFDLFAAKLIEERDGFAPVRFNRSSIRSRWKAGPSASWFDDESEKREAVDALMTQTDADLVAPPQSARPRGSQSYEPKFEEALASPSNETEEADVRLEDSEGETAFVGDALDN